MSGLLEGGVRGRRSHGPVWRMLWGRGRRREACFKRDASASGREKVVVRGVECPLAMAGEACGEVAKAKTGVMGKSGEELASCFTGDGRRIMSLPMS